MNALILQYAPMLFQDNSSKKRCYLIFFLIRISRKNIVLSKQYKGAWGKFEAFVEDDCARLIYVL